MRLLALTDVYKLYNQVLKEWKKNGTSERIYTYEKKPGKIDMEQQCVSPSIAHPELSSVIVFANGEHLTATNVDSGEVVFCHSFDSPILAFSVYRSTSGELLYAVSTDDKHVYVMAESGDRKFLFAHRKRVSGVYQISDHAIIFMDMFGEVYSLDFRSSQEPVLMFGHFAVITASRMIGNRILTGDRDEKIRVSLNRTAEIFCFGHKAYVSFVDGFARLEENFFVSASADGVVRLFEGGGGSGNFRAENFRLDYCRGVSQPADAGNFRGTRGAARGGGESASGRKFLGDRKFQEISDSPAESLRAFRRSSGGGLPGGGGGDGESEISSLSFGVAPSAVRVAEAGGREFGGERRREAGDQAAEIV